MLVFATRRSSCPARQRGGVPPNPINFGWKDKIAPRIGAAWDVFPNGKMKVFGSYRRVLRPVMKLNLAISSFGGQYWQQLLLRAADTNYTAVDPAFNGNNRYCSGSSSDDS